MAVLRATRLASMRATQPRYRGPLDRIGAIPAVAFSLRRLRFGSLDTPVRARRGSDNGEADIGFTDGNVLDQNALLEHTMTGQTALLGGVSGYTVENATVTTNATAQTIGIVETTANGLHRASKPATASLVPGTAYSAVSIVRRAGPQSRDFLIELNNLGNFAVAIVFRLNTLSFQNVYSIGATGISGRVWLLRPGVWLCEMFFTPNVTAAGVISNATLMLTGTSTNRAYTGDGASGLTITAPSIYVAATEARAFATNLYDQSGLASNAFQNTASLQPRIVNAGTIDTINGKPCIAFLGSQFLTHPNIQIGNNATISIVGRANTSAAPQNFVSGAAGSGSFRTVNNALDVTRTGQVQIETSSATASMPTGVVMSFVMTPSATTAFANGIQVGSGPPLSATSPQSHIGAAFLYGVISEYLTGGIGEILIFNSALSAVERQTIERNQGAFYGIGVA